MFTGIIKATGTLLKKETTQTGIVVWQVASSISHLFQLGQSVAHDGVCLTVTAVDGSTHTVEIIPETLSHTTLAHKKPGDPINLEPSITPTTPLDGHIVQGHVDCVLMCIDRKEARGEVRLRFALPCQFSHLVVEKGSIAINGVSLTVALRAKDWFEVALIPHTLHNTNLGVLHPGSMANAEFDIIGKYVAQILKSNPDKTCH